VPIGHVRHTVSGWTSAQEGSFIWPPCQDPFCVAAISGLASHCGKYLSSQEQVTRAFFSELKDAKSARERESEYESARGTVEEQKRKR